MPCAPRVAGHAHASHTRPHSPSVQSVQRCMVMGLCMHVHGALHPRSHGVRNSHGRHRKAQTTRPRVRARWSAQRTRHGGGGGVMVGASHIAARRTPPRLSYSCAPHPATAARVRGGAARSCAADPSAIAPASLHLPHSTHLTSQTVRRAHEGGCALVFSLGALSLPARHGQPLSTRLGNARPSSSPRLGGDVGHGPA